MTPSSVSLLLLLLLVAAPLALLPVLAAARPLVLAPSAAAATATNGSQVSRSWNASGILHFGSWSAGSCTAGSGVCWNASLSGPARSATGHPELALLDGDGVLLGGERFSFWEVASAYRHTQAGDGYGVLLSARGHCLALPRMPTSTADLVPFESAACSWADDASQMLQTWRAMRIGDGIRYFGFFGDKVYNPNTQNTLYGYSNTSDAKALVGMYLLTEQYPATYWLWFNDGQ